MEHTDKENTTQAAQRIMGMLMKPNPKIPQLRNAVDAVFYATQGGPFNIKLLAAKVDLDKKLEKKIINICSNDYYSGKNPIRQIGQAIRRLGPVGFRGVAMQAFLELDVYSNPKWERTTTAIRNYSLAVAHACRITSQRVAEQGDLAFLLGILHRIGISVSLLKLPTPKEDLNTSSKGCEAISTTHPSISQFILQKWGMPESLIKTIGCYGQIMIDDKPSKLSAILIVSEKIIQMLGQKEPQLPTKEKVMEIEKDSFHDACMVLNLSENDIPSLVKDTQETLRSSAKRI